MKTIGLMLMSFFIFFVIIPRFFFSLQIFGKSYLLSEFSKNAVTSLCYLFVYLYFYYTRMYLIYLDKYILEIFTG